MYTMVSIHGVYTLTWLQGARPSPFKMARKHFFLPRLSAALEPANHYAIATYETQKKKAYTLWFQLLLRLLLACRQIFYVQIICG